MLDMMVDIETLSDSRIGAPWAIGWAVFDPLGDGITGAGYFTVDAQDFLDVGMEANWSTLRWWFGQSEAARRLVDQEPKSGPEGLIHLAAIYESLSKDRPVWAYPSDFDLAILAEAYRRIGLPLPWHRRSTRCSKSVFQVSGLDYDRTKENFAPAEERLGLVKHRPDHDCIRQVYFLQAALRRINEID